jgi:hypothetical protein
MSDMQGLALFTLVLTCVIISVAAARRIVKQTGGTITAVSLSISSCLGIAASLPFRGVRPCEWVPVVAPFIFAAAVLSSALCCLCHIREQTKPEQ